MNIRFSFALLILGLVPCLPAFAQNSPNTEIFGKDILILSPGHAGVRKQGPDDRMQ